VSAEALDHAKALTAASGEFRQRLDDRLDGIDSWLQYVLKQLMALDERVKALERAGQSR